ncbi:MAG: glycine cleavage system protein [Chloroflexi bacterium]|nr:glycine cleavage system protein [Chloroflexota bacterium]
MNPNDLRFAGSHEWISAGDPMTIGISQFAQDQLGDVVFVELPKVGATFKAGETIGSVESVKTVSDLYAPIDFTVTEVNSALVDKPELVNSSPYGDGWLLKVTGNAADRDKLMDLNTYESTAAH